MIRFLVGIPVAILIVITAISVYLQPNNFVGCDDVPTGSGLCQKVDAIIAVSGGDTNARTDAAISLFQRGWADIIIFSGAAQDKSGPSNAAAMSARAVAAGVPVSVIKLDEYAETTEQNAANSQTIFQENNINKVILVTSGYHQRRSSLEFNKRAYNVTILNWPTDDSDWNFWWWTSTRGWWLAGSEIAKVIVFHVRGVSE